MDTKKHHESASILERRHSDKETPGSRLSTIPSDDGNLRMIEPSVVGKVVEGQKNIERAGKGVGCFLPCSYLVFFKILKQFS